MARRKKSLHFNLQPGENIPFHREHRSKKGRNKFYREGTEAAYLFRKKKEALRQDVDSSSLRYLRKRYNIY